MLVNAKLALALSAAASLTSRLEAGLTLPRMNPIISSNEEAGLLGGSRPIHSHPVRLCPPCHPSQKAAVRWSMGWMSRRPYILEPSFVGDEKRAVQGHCEDCRQSPLQGRSQLLRLMKMVVMMSL